VVTASTCFATLRNITKPKQVIKVNFILEARGTNVDPLPSNLEIVSINTLVVNYLKSTKMIHKPITVALTLQQEIFLLLCHF